MPTEILMPALSPTMTEGNLAKWHVKEGDNVKAGDVLAEIETDKATMEVEAVDEGTIAKILVTEGSQGVQVNSMIAVLLEEDEDAKGLEEFLAKAGNSNKAAAEAKPAEAKPAAPAQKAAPAPTPQLAKPAPAAGARGNSRVFITPLARRMAADRGIDPRSIQGSGPHGRIIKSDVENYRGGGAMQTVQVDGETPYTVLEPSTMRQVIAKRLVESKQQVPHFYLNIDCQLDNLLEVRRQLNAGAQQGDEEPRYKISVNDMIIKAIGLGLRDVPEANASWVDNQVWQYSRADVSVAVAIDGGLITPIIKGADMKGIIQISQESKELIAKARANKLAPHEFQGGTFSLSNLGMFGIKDFAAIINPPQGCILAVGAGEERPIVEHGELTIATMVTCTLSVDHRVVDGAVGANFLAAFKKYIENPVLMLV